jgi:hypothetical protein
VTAYLFAVQDSTGREVVAAQIDTDKVSEVTAVREESRVHIVHGDTTVDTGYAPPEEPLQLHRWPADDKLNDDARVSHPIK